MTETLFTKVTPEVKNKLEEEATKLGLAISVYIRMILLKELDKNK